MAKDAGGVGLVHHQERVVPVGDGCKFLKRREIAVHAVEAFGHDPRTTLATLRPPLPDRGFDRLGIVVAKGSKFSAAGARALMDARMHQRIEHEQVAPLRQRCQHGEIGDISAGKVDRGLRAEKAGGLGLQALMLVAVAAQEPRTPCPDWRTRLDRGRYRPAHAGRGRKPEIIV